MNEQPTGLFDKISEKHRAVAMLAAALAVVLIGQLALSRASETPAIWEVNAWLSGLGDNTSPLLGLILYASSGVLFIKAIGLLGVTHDVFQVSVENWIPHPARFGFWVTSLGLTCLTLFFSSHATPTSFALGFEGVALVSIYLFSISLYFSESWVLLSYKKAWNWIISHRIELVIITIVVLVAFFVRFLNLELHPYSFINDEGEMGRHGVCLLQGYCLGLMDIDWSQQAMLAFLPTGLSVSLLGNTALAVRLVSVIIGTLAVLAVYLFTRDVFDSQTALVAAALLATLPLHVHFSRLGVDNIVDSLSTTLILWMLFRGFKTSSTVYFLLAGTVAGLCFYTYPGSRLSPALGLLAIVAIGLNTKGFVRAYGRKITIFLLAIFIVSAPMVGYFITHPRNFFGRMDVVGLFGTGTLESEMQSKGYDLPKVILMQFMKSTLVYTVTGAPGNFFNSPIPYLTPLTAIFFIMGMAYTIWRLKDPRYILIFVWFWIVVILGSTLTGGPPTSERLLMSTPALVIITAIGISRAIDSIHHVDRLGNWFVPFILVTFVVYTGVQNLSFYFGDYQTGHYFEDPTNEFTYETRTLISPLHDRGRLYLITEPGIPFLSFASIAFFAPNVEKSYLQQVDHQTLSDLPSDKDALFIATPGQKAELDLVAREIPGGFWQQINRRYQPDQPLFFSYQVGKQLLINFVH